MMGPPAPYPKNRETSAPSSSKTRGAPALVSHSARGDSAASATMWEASALAAPGQVLFCRPGGAGGDGEA